MARPLEQKYVDSLRATISPLTKSVSAEVGVRIKAKRESLGLSQSDIAQVLDVDRSVISMYETGAVDVPLSRLVALSTILSMTVADLFPDPDESPADEVNDSRYLIERMRSIMDTPNFQALLIDEASEARKKK